MTAQAKRPQAAHLAGRAWDQLSMYMPVILMGVLALGTYWLARNTPTFTAPQPQRAATHEPDYYMRGFSVKNFDPAGRLKSEVRGSEARHYPDTDTFEVDQPRIRAYNAQGALTLASADRAISNADGTQVQLLGNAVVTRESINDTPRLEIRGDFLQAFLDTERVRSEKPVVIRRGDDQFAADQLDYDNVERVLQMRGRVRGVLAPRDGR